MDKLRSYQCQIQSITHVRGQRAATIRWNLLGRVAKLAVASTRRYWYSSCISSRWWSANLAASWHDHICISRWYGVPIILLKFICTEIDCFSVHVGTHTADICTNSCAQHPVANGIPPARWMDAVEPVDLGKQRCWAANAPSLPCAVQSSLSQRGSSSFATHKKFPFWICR
jgi:hypothetical protein